MEYEIDQECSTYREIKNSYKIVKGNPEGKRPILEHLEINRVMMLKP
jgi:cell wall assembly regulator SMI1